jgi:hypothetical protein
LKLFFSKLEEAGRKLGREPKSKPLFASTNRDGKVDPALEYRAARKTR